MFAKTLNWNGLTRKDIQRVLFESKNGLIVFLSVHIIKSVIVITTRNKGLCSCKSVLLMTVLYIMMLFLLKF